jgi:GTP-binding protein HflX
VPRPKALLLSLTEQNAEMEELLYSLGFDLDATIVQKRARPDPATFVGSGKVEELQSLLRARNGAVGPAVTKGHAGEALQRAERSAVLGPEGRGRDGTRAHGAAAEDAGQEPVALVAVNAHLKPSQVAELERLFKVDVFDRVRVILEIFQQRAHTQEAKLQVELARLRYERPLVAEYVHLAKRGEHPGFMAGGAYAVDQYYTTINGRISRIQQELARIAAEREVRRRHRRRGGFQLVSLAGYTNAGKSSLLKRLSGEDVLVENRMFSTLETRTGRARAHGRNLLVTDTVGFVDGLPPELVQAFRSTLEEIAHADCIVLVCDASDAPAEVARKLATSARVLRDYPDLAPLVLALNKADRVPPARRGPVEDEVRRLGVVEEGQWVWVSALRGTGLDELEEHVLRHVPPMVRARATLPRTGEAESILGAMYEDATVTRVERDAMVEVEFEAPAAVLGQLTKRIQQSGGTVRPLP